LWDGKTGKKLADLGDVSFLDFSPDGAFLVTQSQSNAGTLWDAKAGKKLADLGAMGDRFQFSPSGALLTTSSPDHVGTLWDVKTAKKLVELGNVRFYSLSPDEALFVVISQDGAGVCSPSIHLPGKRRQASPVS
jgi:WD40 repeat protein